MKNNLNILLIIFFIFLYSCTSVSNAVQGKKRSDQSDEFLIKKKNPLVMPPDYDQMPVPIEEEIADSKNQNNEIKEILKVEDNTNSTKNENTKDLSIEQSILKKID